MNLSLALGKSIIKCKPVVNTFSHLSTTNPYPLIGTRCCSALRLFKKINFINSISITFIFTLGVDGTNECSYLQLQLRRKIKKEYKVSRCLLWRSSIKKLMKLCNSSCCCCSCSIVSRLIKITLFRFKKLFHSLNKHLINYWYSSTSNLIKYFLICTKFSFTLRLPKKINFVNFIFLALTLESGFGNTNEYFHVQLQQYMKFKKEYVEFGCYLSCILLETLIVPYSLSGYSYIEYIVTPELIKNGNVIDKTAHCLDMLCITSLITKKPFYFLAKYLINYGYKLCTPRYTYFIGSSHLSTDFIIKCGLGHIANEFYIESVIREEVIHLNYGICCKRCTLICCFTHTATQLLRVHLSGSKASDYLVWKILLTSQSLIFIIFRYSTNMGPCIVPIYGSVNYRGKAINLFKTGIEAIGVNIGATESRNVALIMVILLGKNKPMLTQYLILNSQLFMSVTNCDGLHKLSQWQPFVGIICGVNDDLVTSDPFYLNWANSYSCSFYSGDKSAERHCGALFSLRWIYLRSTVHVQTTILVVLVSKKIQKAQLKIKIIVISYPFFCYAQRKTTKQFNTAYSILANLKIQQPTVKSEIKRVHIASVFKRVKNVYLMTSIWNHSNFVIRSGLKVTQPSHVVLAANGLLLCYLHESVVPVNSKISRLDPKVTKYYLQFWCGGHRDICTS